MEDAPVYVAILNAEGHPKCLGVFRHYTDAMYLCKKEAEKWAEELYSEDYEYEKVHYSDYIVCVDTFSWEVVKMYIRS